MRSQWSFFKAATGALSLGILISITGYSGDVIGDTPKGSGSEAAPLPAPAEGAVGAVLTAQPQKDPFTPYDVGGPEAVWPYESLTPAEQAVIDHNRGAAGWKQVHEGFGAAVLERSRKARAGAAEHELGIDGLEFVGVVP